MNVRWNVVAAGVILGSVWVACAFLLGAIWYVINIGTVATTWAIVTVVDAS